MACRKNFNIRINPGQQCYPELLSARNYLNVAPKCMEIKQNREIWELGYNIDSGHPWTTSDENTVTKISEADTAFLIPPGEKLFVDHRPILGHYGHLPTVFFSGGELESGLKEFAGKRAEVSFFADPEHLLRHHILHCCKFAEAGNRVYAARAEFYRIMDLLLNFSAPYPEYGENWFRLSIRNMRSTVSDLHEKLREWYNEHPAEKFVIQKFAKGLCMGESAFRHKFKTETGVSPLQALLTFRLERAKMLLWNDMPVKEVAQECGFSSEYHLMKFFRDKTGETIRNFCNNS